MSYDWDFSPVFRNYPLFLEGLLNTLILAVSAIALGMAIGLALGIMRLTGRWSVSMPAGLFIDFYRNTPPLVHFFWIYYGLPIITGAELSPFTSALLALSLQSGAFFAEVFRGGIMSIERGQWEGAKSIGMGYATMMRRIILPQATRRMIPPLMERSFELTKTTALAATVSYGELLYQAMTIASQSFRPLETYTAVAVIFFTLLFTVSMAMRWVEARLHQGR